MLKPDTIKIQQDLAMYCRTGEAVEIPGTRPERLPHYRRLVYNVVNNTMEHAFPISFEILDKQEWKELIDRFFIEHDAQTPKIWELPYEFFLYVRAHGYAEKFNKPYLNDLLYFEWVEIEVHTMQDQVNPEITKKGNLISDPIALNRDSRLIRLRYPVHMLGVNEAAEKEGNYYVFIFREVDTGTVRFVNFTVLHVYLFEKFYLNKTVVSDYIYDIARKFNLKDMQLLEKEIQRFLQELLDLGGILGFVKQKK